MLCYGFFVYNVCDLVMCVFCVMYSVFSVSGVCWLCLYVESWFFVRSLCGVCDVCGLLGKGWGLCDVVCVFRIEGFMFLVVLFCVFFDVCVVSLLSFVFFCLCELSGTCVV